MSEPFVRGDDHDACGVCPARRYSPGDFDVHERPSRDAPFDPADAHRYTADRVPVCVHPERVGLPAGRYKSDGAPVPFVTELVLPADAADLDQCLRHAFHNAAPGLTQALIDQAVRDVPAAFPDVDLFAALRRALG